MTLPVDKENNKLVKIPLPYNAVFTFPECCQHAPNCTKSHANIEKISGVQPRNPAAGAPSPDPREGKGKGERGREEGEGTRVVFVGG
jgi:hypothetical protein